MDVKTAYSNAPIDCEIYVEQAGGFETLNSDENERLVYTLNFMDSSSLEEIGTCYYISV